jgi:hypothetical protein
MAKAVRLGGATDQTEFEADPWIPMLQMHIEKDTLGSRQMITK